MLCICSSFLSCWLLIDDSAAILFAAILHEQMMQTSTNCEKRHEWVVMVLFLHIACIRLKFLFGFCRSQWINRQIYKTPHRKNTDTETSFQSYTGFSPSKSKRNTKSDQSKYIVVCLTYSCYLRSRSSTAKVFQNPPFH